MTSVTSAPAVPPARHSHHHQRAAAATDPLASTSGAASTADSPPSGSGIQNFASELQSILLSAQSGQAGAPASTADNATASPARTVADRLQALLGGSDAAPASQSGGLQGVLDKLQQTLQQTLQSYQVAAPAAPTAGVST